MKITKSLFLLWGGIIFFVAAPMTVSAGDGVTRYWGVVVGISDYQLIEGLDFSADDASAVHDLLVRDSRWSPERVVLLTNAQASRAAVLNAFQNVSEKSDDDDLFLFFFSGHGGQADDDFLPLDESDGLDEYLTLWDSSPYDYSGDLVDDDLANSLQQIRGKKVVLIDSCHSGGQVKGIVKGTDESKIKTSRKSKFTKKLIEGHSGVIKRGDGFANDLVQKVATKDLNQQSHIIVLTSTDDFEVSYESPEFQQGEFTYFLLLALKSHDANGNGAVSVEEIYDYVYPALTHFNPEVTPQLYDVIPGEVDLVQPTFGRLVFVGSIFGFSWEYPFNTWFKKRRSEYIYTPAQLGSQGIINKIKIFAEEIPGLPLNNCTIRMKHTPSSSYGVDPQWTSFGWTTVFSGTKSINRVGPVTFDLTTPFSYDGVSHLKMDFSFSNPNFVDSGFFYCSLSENYSMIHYSDDDEFGSPLTWSGTSPPPVRDENGPDFAGSYLDLELEFQATVSTRTVGGSPGWTRLDVSANEQLQLNLNITNSHGDSSPEITGGWLVLTATVGGRQLPVYVMNAAGLHDVGLVSDLSAVTYSFNYGADVATIATLALGSLGLKTGDTFTYGYAYTTSDVSHIVLDNGVVLEVR